jgi:hypothetical protein
MKLSSVSPERWETNCRYPAFRQMAMASSVSVTVPIWLSLISEELPMPRSMAPAMMPGFVQKMSSPTNSVVVPSRLVSATQPASSSSPSPSSIRCTGNSSTMAASRSISAALSSSSPATR